MRRGILAIAGVVVLVVVIAQFALPAFAARRLRSDLERRGTDVRVEVEAFPAFKLLWHRADRVTVRVSDYRSGESRSGASLSDVLASTKDTGELDARVRVLDANPLVMHDVSLRKVGDRMTGEVRLRREDIDAALPQNLEVQAQPLPNSQLAVAGETSIFGRQLVARARILLEDGRIVIRPEGFPLASLVTVPIFSDPRIAVDALSTRVTPDGFLVTARGHLRG